MSLPYSTALRGKRVLVVEDSYLVAQELAEALDREGASIVGPIASLDAANHVMLDAGHLDAAILDVSLRGETIWPVADMLLQRQVRIVFATAYPKALIRQRYAGIDIVEKPAPARLIIRMLSQPETLSTR